MYQISIKRDGFNPLTGRAAYRVKISGFILVGKNIVPKSGFVYYSPHSKTLYINSEVMLKAGTFINPAKVLFEKGK